MIELGNITIKDETSLVESRNKIFILARDLKFDLISATRLTTVTSELIRWMAQSGKPSHIKAGLGTKSGVFGLILKFVSQKKRGIADNTALESIFDSIEISTQEKDIECIEAFKALPDPSFDISEEFIAEEKEKIGRLTRDELYIQLKDAYRDLRDKTTQLIQTEKLGTIGTMTAGIAHELNNPMMGLINFIQYSIKHTSADDKRYTVLKDAEHEAKRCIDIVENLLTFSRLEKEDKEGGQKESCAVVIDRVLLLLSYRTEKEGITVTKKYGSNIPKIWMKTNNIQQVFLNLINNAMDALKERDKKEINIEIGREEEFVRVIVTDSGCGIPEGSLLRIFEPFFTTKPAGGGTGLGLFVCRNIVEEHNGRIICESKLGKYTSFKVFLPVERK